MSVVDSSILQRQMGRLEVLFFGVEMFKIVAVRYDSSSQMWAECSAGENETV
jgi:hypothetical protein